MKQPPLTWELSGSWTYRSFENKPEPIYQTPPQQAHLIWLEAALQLRQVPTDATGLEGTIEWSGGGLDLKATVLWVDPHGHTVFDIVGTGRRDTDTADWEYRYHGHQTPRLWLPKPLDVIQINQVPTLRGSVIRVHGEGAPAGYVAPFIAVKR